LNNVIQVQAAIAAHSRELETFLQVVETQQPDSTERKASEAALYEMAKQLGMGLREIFGGYTTEVERDAVSAIVRAVPAQLAKSPTLVAVSGQTPQEAQTVWRLEEVVRRHVRVALSVLYGRDPEHRDKCWRCWHRWVSALERDRCAICTWVICPQCGAGGFECLRCTAGGIYTPQPLVAQTA
jgi:hypothetical protein